MLLYRYFLRAGQYYNDNFGETMGVLYKVSSNRKGQSSLEVLMTYGWLFIAIIIVMVIAWQWGLFDFSGTVTPGSAGFWGVVPTDSRLLSAGVLDIALTNNVGADVTVTSINISSGSSSVTYPTPTDIPIGRTVTISSISGLSAQRAGDNFNIFVIIEYNDSRTGDIFRSSGNIWGTYEA